MTDPMMRRDALTISLAGDMWNELENLRSLWEGTDRAVWCERLIADYESIIGSPIRGDDR